MANVATLDAAKATRHASGQLLKLPTELTQKIVNSLNTANNKERLFSTHSELRQMRGPREETHATRLGDRVHRSMLKPVAISLDMVRMMCRQPNMTVEQAANIVAESGEASRALGVAFNIEGEASGHYLIQKLKPQSNKLRFRIIMHYWFSPNSQAMGILHRSGPICIVYINIDADPVTRSLALASLTATPSHRNRYDRYQGDVQIIAKIITGMVRYHLRKNPMF